MFRKKVVYSLGLAAILLVPAGCGKKDSTVVLKLGHGLDVNHPVHKAMVYMADVFARKSNGRGRIDIYPGEQLGSERDMIEQLQFGSLALTKTSTSPLESFIPVMGVFSLPFLLRDKAHLYAVLDGEIGKELLDAGLDKGLKGLCFYDAGFRSFYTRAKPVAVPNDLKGMKIRVQQAKTAMDMVKAFDASPTPISWGELYTSLAQGVVDGAENNPPSFETAKHYEVCKHYCLDEHACPPDLVLISTVWWGKLDAALQAALKEAADSSAAYERVLWNEKVENSLKTVEAAGVTVVRPDKALFQSKVAPMHSAYEGTPIGDFIKRIQAVQ
jgi:tripartite ATP-independent transporter DctP family solute receptor